MKTLMTHLFALALSLAWVSIAQGDPSPKAKRDAHPFPARPSVAESLPIRNPEPVGLPTETDAEEAPGEILVVEQSPPTYERAEPRWAPVVLEQTRPVYERACSLAREDAALILQVLADCGDVRDTGTSRNNPLLECWDVGRLTLTAEQVIRFQRFANHASPCELLSADGCWKDYCAEQGYR